MGSTLLDTPFLTGWAHYLAEGLLVGAGTALRFVCTGRIGGMSSVFFQHLVLAGAAGLIVGAPVWSLGFSDGAALGTRVPAWQLLLGGFFVGYGARLSNGCTSGHGICGLGSLQLPFLGAVLTFMSWSRPSSRPVRSLSSVWNRDTWQGGTLFGLGWGLCGVCPGRAITGLATGNMDLLWALAGIALGALAQEGLRAEGLNLLLLGGGRHGGLGQQAAVLDQLGAQTAVVGGASAQQDLLT